MLKLCESCCLSEYTFITCREVLSPRLIFGIGASKTILSLPQHRVIDIDTEPASDR